MRAIVLSLALLCVATAEASTQMPPALDPAIVLGLDPAFVLGLDLSPHDLLPPPDLVAALRADLAAINTYDPFFETFVAQPSSPPGYLVVGLTDAAWADYLAGQYHGLDDLNQKYGPVDISAYEFIKALGLSFHQPYNSPVLAQIYATATGLRYAEVTGYVGEPFTDIDCVILGRYLYRKGWGDCPAGCEYHHYWDIQVTNGTVTLLRSWGDDVPTAVHSTSWGRLKVRFR